MGPVTHDHHRRAIISNKAVVDVTPTGAQVIFISIVKGLIQDLQRLGHPLVVPCRLTGEEPQIVGLIKLGDEDILEDMATEVWLNFGNRQGRDASGFERFGSDKELVPRLGRFGNAGGLKLAGAIPEHVGAVNVDRHRIRLAFVGGNGDQILGEDIVQPFFFIEEAQILHAIGHDMAVDQLAAQVDLEGIRWLTTLHAGFEQRLHVAALAGTTS